MKPSVISATVGLALVLIVGFLLFDPYGAVGLLILICLAAVVAVPIIALVFRFKGKEHPVHEK